MAFGVVLNLCECGCGLRTEVAKRSRLERGWIKGQPMRYIRGHNTRVTPTKVRDLTGAWKIDAATQCWVWQRTRDRGGYGAVRGNSAHRLVYEMHVGPIPAGLELDHLCRNRACVNPAHLEPVTRAENCRRGANAKITSAVARTIREALVRNESPAAIARQLGIPKSVVYNLKYHNTWRGA